MTKLITTLKESDQDFEFYPTTNEIIRAMIEDLLKASWKRDRWNRIQSVLDVGAGNGKVLEAFRHQDLDIEQRFAIEKSPVLCAQLPDDVMIVGTEFEQQSLISKPVDVVFSNPPYSVFEQWAVKIIREAAAKFVYLVTPVRWQESIEIREALKFRESDAHIVGTYDFNRAEDRQARARVHLLRIDLPSDRDDAFERFFDEAFGGLREKFEADSKEQKTNDTHAKFNELVVGATYPEAMVSLYLAEMARIQRNYEAVASLDVEIMRELNVTPATILAGLKARLSGLRNLYWAEIFNRLNTITDRLTSKKRKQMLDALNRHVHVDFTVSNIHVIVLWVIRNANQHFDDQLVETFEQMVEKANVVNYKSNRIAFVCDRWRYMNDPGSRPTHFALEYRIVLQHSGGISTSSWSYSKGLEERAAELLGDLLTVARNLGFVGNTTDRRLLAGRSDWESNKLETFYFTNARTGQQEALFDVRAFKNGNMHIRLNQRFALALNVEYGRLKGWLKSGGEAANELGDLEAETLFRSNLALPMTGNPVLLLAA